jgi:hypothetical protein
MVWRDSTDKGGTVLKCISDVEVNIIWKQPLVIIHIRCRLVCRAHVSRDLAVPFKEFKQDFLWILEGFLEIELLVPSLSIKERIVLRKWCSFYVSPLHWSLSLVFGDQLIETWRLLVIVNLSAIEFSLCEGDRGPWIVYNSVDISWSHKNSSCKLLLVIDWEPSLDGLDNMRFEDCGCFELGELFILKDFEFLRLLRLWPEEGRIVCHISDFSEFLLCFLEWNRVNILNEDFLLLVTCGCIDFEPLLSIDLHNLVEHSQTLFVVFIEFLEPDLHFRDVLGEKQLGQYL